MNVEQELHAIKERITRLEAEDAAIKTDVNAIKGDVAQIKTKLDSFITKQTSIVAIIAISAEAVLRALGVIQ